MLHKLSLLDASPYASGRFACNVCRERGCGPVYHCADCDFDVHLTCAATATQQTHITHPQHLLRLVQCSTLTHICDSCGTKICTLSFRCDMCNFDIHPTCVRAPRFIQHPTHPHPLTLSNSSAANPVSFQCDGCRRPVSKSFYRCDRPLPGRGLACGNYVLHQGCATLPTRVKHPKHPQHILTLLDEPPCRQEEVFSCGGCGAQLRGWHFNCASCDFSLHPGCAPSVHEFMQPVQDRSKANSSTTTSVDMHNVSHASTALPVLTQAPIPSDKDWEAFEKVVRFARESATGPLMSVGASNDSAQSGVINEEEDICPTCLEGYDSCNPKKVTSCGHQFHLNCILNWMERSSRCPVCRKFVSIPM